MVVAVVVVVVVEILVIVVAVVEFNADENLTSSFRRNQSIYVAQ